MNDKEKKLVKVEDIKTEAETEQCPVKKAIYYINQFLEGPMCGRCFPCSMGSYEAELILRRLALGKGMVDDIARLKRIAEHMAVASLCKKGKDTAAFMQEWLNTGHMEKHIEGICPDRICCAYVEYRIIPEKCDLCGLCKKVCEFDAIHGEEKRPYLSGYLPFEIRQKKCVKCGECIKVCPTGAIILIDVKECATVSG